MFRLKLGFNTLLKSQNRKSTTKSIISVIVAIFIAVIFSVILAAVLGYDPAKLIQDLFVQGAIDVNKLIYNIVVLGIAAIAFSFAFKVGTFNIGMPGQMITAAMIVIICSKYLGSVLFPQGTGQMFMLLISFVSGATVGLIIGLMNVFLKVNVVISSILINWVAFFLLRFLIVGHAEYNPGGAAITSSITIPDQFLFSDLSNPVLKYLTPGLILLIILAVGVWFVFKFTVFGKKISAVGLSATGSQYAGYNTKTLTLTTMIVSAGIAGVLGYVVYASGGNSSVSAYINADALPIEGFNGIVIGLIAMNNPIAILPVSFIIGLFQNSAPFLQTPPTFSALIIGLVMFGASMFVVFLAAKPWIWSKRWIYGRMGPHDYLKYENSFDALISKYWGKLYEINHLYKLKRRNPELLNEIYADDYVQLQKLLLTNKKTAIKQLNMQFDKEAALINAQYKKHKIIANATRYFSPELELDFRLNHKLNKMNLAFGRQSGLKAIALQEKTYKFNTKINELEILKTKTDDLNKIHSYEIEIDKLRNLIYVQTEKLENEAKAFEQQVEKTKLNFENLKNKKKRFYSQKKLQTIYQNSLNSINELELENKEKHLLIDWMNDSYQSALKHQLQGEN